MLLAASAMTLASLAAHAQAVTTAQQTVQPAQAATPAPHDAQSPQPTSAVPPAPQAKTAPAPSSAATQPAATPLPDGIRAATLIEGISEYHLANGLTVLLAPDDSRAQTTVNMSYRVGSVNEGAGETGMAHLLEHLMFRGSPKHPDALAEFARRGLAANGSTSTDLTNYYATFASDPDTLRWYLSWQADAMLNARISREDLDAEMTVVRNEMERGENSPFGMLLQQTDAAAYVWHPYGRSVIGARSDVEHVDVAQLRAFYHRYYQPDNAVLIITGRFDAKQTLRWVAEAFGALPRPARTLAAPYTVEPVQQGARSVTLRRIGGSPIAVVQYHIPQAESDTFTALSIGTDMLADSPSGPLYKALVDKGLASSVFGFARAMKYPGYVVFGAQLQDEAKAAEALGVLEQTLESTGADSLDDAALTRARTAWLNDWRQTYNQPAGLAQALSNAVAQGDWRLFFIHRDQVQALTLEQVGTALKTWLLASNRTSGLYLPTPQPHDAPAASKADLAPWLAKLQTGTQRPTVAAFDTDPASIDAATQRETMTLPNGRVQLALLPKPAAGGQVYVRLRMRGGTVQALEGLNLVPEVTARMLMRGSTDMTRQQIEDRLNALDSELYFTSDGNTLTASLRSTRQDLDQALALTLHLMRQPAFPEEELDKLRRSLSVAVHNQATSPGFLVRNALQRHDQPWKPEDYRYEATPEETQAWIQALTRERLLKFHERFYGAGNLLLSAVGDFDPQALKDELKKGLSGWSEAPAFERIPEPWYAIQPHTFHIPAPGKANAEYLALMPLKMQDTDPRWPAVMLANYLLGGSEDSRLWQAVRVREGLSYSVSSSVETSAWEASGTWSMAASAAAQNAATLQRAMHDTLEATLKSGFTQTEVDHGVVSLSNFLQLGRSSDAYLAARWLAYLDTGRSFAWQQHILDRLKALDAAQVTTTLRDILKPDALAIAVAADPGAGK